MTDDHVRLGHGSGGVLTRRLIEQRLLPVFDSPLLASLPDSAWLEVAGARLAFTTDTYTVEPPFFPGGDIGKLAVCGTVNDLAVAGALPRYITCALLLEEGLPMADLNAVLASMRRAADDAGVEVVTGDTKVVPRGKADRVFINTAGIGTLAEGTQPPRGQVEVGDVIIVSGPVGDHGAAVIARREGINLDAPVLSDCAPLTHAAQAVLHAAARCGFMRDLTRGGLATVMNELTGDGRPGVLLREADVPVREAVRGIGELLGIDPLYMACEGRLAAVVDAPSAPAVLRALRAVPGSERSAAIGEVTDARPGQVALQTPLGTHRLLQMLSGEQLPRIC